MVQAAPNPMRQLSPFSRKMVEEFYSGFDHVAMFTPLMPLDYLLEVHNFNTAIETAHWTAVNAGTAPTDFAFNSQRNGALRGATGTTTNNVVALHKAQLYFDAADKPLMVVRFKNPAAVSSYVFEIGFSDAKTAENAVSVTDIDTPAIGNGVTDGVFVAMDTAQTLQTAALVADGATGGVAKTNIGTWTPTVSVWVEMVIGFEANKSFVSIVENGKDIGRYSVAQGPDAGVLVRPSLLFKTLNTTSKQIDIDSIILMSEVNAT